MKINKELVKIFFAFFLVLFLIIIAIVFLYFHFRSKDISEVTSARALLVVVEPQISIIRGEETIAVRGDEIEVHKGDIIETDENGVGYIIFSDNSLISLDKNTQIEIEEYENSENSFEIKINQFLGRTWSRIERLIGKDSDYEVETLNTVASVRGTSFGCDIEGDVTFCYVTDGEVQLRLKNLKGIENEFSLGEGKAFRNDEKQIQDVGSYEELLELIEDFEQEEDEWLEFIECLEIQLSRILQDEENRTFNYLIEHLEDLECGEVLGAREEVGEEEEEVPEETTTTIPYYPPGTTTSPPPLVSEVGIWIEGGVDRVTCSWSAQNASNYEVSIGTSAGSNNMGGWINTGSNNYTFEGPGLVSGETYYCNVRASGDGGTSDVISSEGAYYDGSSGSFYDPSCDYYPPYFEPCDGNMFLDTVRGRGSYSNIPLDHLRVRFSIMNDNDNRYFNGTAWVTDIYWHNVALTEYAGGFEFSRDIDIDIGPYENLTLNFVLYNRFSGNVLDTETITAYTYY